jgi:phosphoribosyl 1,2-cyclic phosphodiesterase
MALSAGELKGTPNAIGQLNVWSLASGSSGNSYLVQSAGTAVLVDAGLGMRALLASIRSLGVDPSTLSAILLTHEHGDHVAGAAPLARKLGVPLVANAATLAAVLRDGLEAPTLALSTGSQLQWRDLELESFPIHHDAVDPVGYRIALGHHRLCFITDTGHLCPRLVGLMSGCDLIVLESNHDVDRLIQGPYAPPLKRRVLSDTGHLSNDVAARAVSELSQGDRPSTIWLAHLSATNNTPRTALRCTQLALQSGHPRNVRLGVALRDKVSLRWRAEENWWQPSLF